MSRSRETYNKKEVRNKKEKKRKDKEKKRLARKDNPKGGGLDDMIAYVDENGIITSTPPDPTKKKEIAAEDIDLDVKKEAVDKTRTGRLVMFNESKGYGFIMDNNTKEKIFVHISNFLDDIKESDLVSFETEKAPAGIRAIQVKLHKA